MKQILGAFRRTSFGTLAALFLLTVVGVALPSRDVSAAGLLYRSLELTSSQPSGVSGASTVPGDADNGGNVGHTYVFQVQTGVALNALKIQYCDGPFGYLSFDDGTGECTAPTGFSADNVTAALVDVYANVAAFESGTATSTNLAYTADAATDANELILTNGSGPTLVANNVVRVTVAPTGSNYFVNPNDAYRTANDTPNKMGTFYAHIETYATSGAATGADNTNPPVDEGTVTSAVASTISINTRVQEVLKFSVEGETLATADGPDTPEGTCDALTGSGNIVMGDPSNNNALSAERAYDAYSYFRMATNSANGAQVLYAGQTLRSTAGDSIAALTTTPTASNDGTEQFGLALAQGFTSTNGNGNQDLIAGGDPNSDLVPETPYASGNIGFDVGNDAVGSYAFDTTSNGNPVLLAKSDDVVRCDTGVVRYIANISNNTPAGLYSTKISYIAVPSY